MDDAVTARVSSIDAIRGFCLLNIFVNHITVGYLHKLSPSGLLLCDSADILVLISGISSHFVHPSGPARFSVRFLKAAAKRCWTIYRMYLIIAASSALAFLAFSRSVESPINSYLLDDPLQVAWHAISMQQAVGYSGVLRLYVVLMATAPFYLWLAGKKYWYPLLPAALIWVLSGHFGWVESDSLTGNPVRLTVLPWHMTFAVGVTIGAAIRQGVPVVRSPWLSVPACALSLIGPMIFLVLAPLWPEAQNWADTRDLFFWTGASKTLQSPLRVLYVVALVYLFVAYTDAPLIRMVHRVRPDSIFCRLGRQSLHVFAFGAVLALLAEQLLSLLIADSLIRQHAAAALVIELAIFAGGCVAMLWIADRREGSGNTATPSKDVTTRAQAIA